MPNRVYDPQYWRERAEETRTYADVVSDAEARRLLLGVAKSYDRLAEHAEAMRRTSEIAPKHD